MVQLLDLSQKTKKLFGTVLRELTLVLKGWGLIDGKIVAIDGTKIRAQNSKHNCITESTLNKKLEYADEQIYYYLTEIEKSDADIDCYKDKLKTYQELKENSMFIAYNLKRLLSMYSVQVLSEKFKRIAL